MAIVLDDWLFALIKRRTFSGPPAADEAVAPPAPVAATLADNVKVSDITGAQTSQVGNAVDLQPLLRPGQYTCGGEQLTVTLSGGTAPPVTWTFARV